MLISEYLNKWRSRKDKRLLGIDFAENSIRLVEVGWINQNYQLLGVHSVPLKSESELTASILQGLKEANFSAHIACFGLENSAVILKTLHLDASLNSQEIEIQAQEHAQRYFNFQFNELLIDFEILGQVKENPGLLDVRWIAAKKPEVDKKIALLSAAGLSTSIVDVKAFALYKVLQLIPWAAAEDLLMLWYESGSKLTMLICDAERLRWFKEINKPSSADALLMGFSQLSQQVLPSLGRTIRKMLFVGISPGWRQILQSQLSIETLDLGAELRKHSWLINLDDNFIDAYSLSLGLAMRVNECQ